jgi:hypothetical protein
LTRNPLVAVPERWRAEALANAVALVAAEYHGVPVDSAALTQGVGALEQQAALVWLAAQIVQHAFGGSGPFVLGLVGSAAQWVDSGGT